MSAGSASKPFGEIKVGVVGIGFVGMAHIEALRRIGVQVVAVVGGDPDRARAKALANHLPAVVETVEELVSDPSIDAVHIASPNSVHAEQTRLVLDAGKHVICEKPMGVHSVETAQMVQQAAASGLVAAVCFNLRFFALNHQIRAMVANGSVGTPRLITGGYIQDWLFQDTDWNWRLEAESGGQLRAMADIGSHWLDLARFVSGQDVVEVMADLHTLLPTRRRPQGPVESFAAATGNTDADADLVEVAMTSDDGAGVLLRFADGARGTLMVSQVSAGHKNQLSIEVAGSKATVAWTSDAPDELWIGNRDEPNQTLMRNAGMLDPSAAAITTYPPGHLEGYADTFRALFDQIYLDVAAGRPSATPRYPTFSDGHDAMLVTEAIARSSEQRQWVAIDRGN